MDFSYSEEQQMLQDSVSKFIEQDYDWDSRKAIVDSDSGYSAAHWQLFAELGWLTVPFKEEDGGFGGSAVDLIVVMEEFGKGLVVEPFLVNTILAGSALAELGSEAQKEALLVPLMAGTMQLALAYAEPHGHKSVVLNGGMADKLLVSVRP